MDTTQVKYNKFDSAFEHFFIEVDDFNRVFEGQYLTRSNGYAFSGSRA